MATLPDKSYSRVIIVQILYILNLSDTEIRDFTEETIDKHIVHIENFYNSASSEDSELIELLRSKAKHQFIKSILMALSQNIESIDAAILQNLSNKDSWVRMHIIIKSLLRAAIAEYITLATTRKVLVDEYVGITRSFFSLKETSFVNATLDKITSTLNKND